ncbi:hypothetical protein Tco_1459386 [Tanacetum coccineum]
MDQDFAHIVVASKVPMLKPGEFELWRMRIEQYIQMIDYSLWEVIENGATLPKTQLVEGVLTVMPITSAEDMAQRRLEVKARSTLMRWHAQFEHQIKAFQKLCEVVLELLGEKLSQEDVNQKLLRSLSLEWNTHAVVWRNKANLDTMSMDDLYKNLKVYKPEVKGISSSNSSTQNMAFVSSSNNNTSNSNEAVNAAHGVTTASTQVTTRLNYLEQQRDKLDLYVVELKRQTVELQKTQSILKRKMSENEDQYHDTYLNLKAKVKKNVDMVLKIRNSLQGMFILGPKPMSFYDSKSKHGLGYANHYTLKKAISQNPKLYDSSCLDD